MTIQNIFHPTFWVSLYIFVMKLLLLCTCLVLSESVKLPPSFQKCNRKQPNWKECVFKAAVDGLSQLTKPFDEVNLPNLEPFFIPAISISAGSKAVRVTQNYKNCKIFGLTKVKADHFEFDFDKKTIELEGTLPELKILGEYSLNGKILLLPIVGEGNGETLLKNLHAKATLQFEEVKKRGKTHIRVVSAKAKLTPGFIHFSFDNLFNGDKVLRDNVLKVMNENWKQVFEDVEEGYTELVKKIFIDLVNKFFNKVSIEEAFD